MHKLVENYPLDLEYALDKYKFQEMCNENIEEYHNMLMFILNILRAYSISLCTAIYSSLLQQRKLNYLWSKFRNENRLLLVL